MNNFEKQDWVNEFDKFTQKLKNKFDNFDINIIKDGESIFNTNQTNKNENVNINSFPNTTVFSDANSFIINAVVPGMNKENIKLSLQGENSIEISGNRINNFANVMEIKSNEIKFGEFKKLVTLPIFNEEIDLSNISAKYESGVLEILIPKKIKKVSTININ